MNFHACIKQSYEHDVLIFQNHLYLLPIYLIYIASFAGRKSLPIRYKMLTGMINEIAQIFRACSEK